MEPHIRYARTSDGVDIAYYVIGSGPPLVALTAWSNIQTDWGDRQLREQFEQVAGAFTLVRLDPRGFGLSGPPPGSHTVEGCALDIEAVADALALPPFSLMAVASNAFPAIYFAHAHPDRLSHLVLESAFVRGGGAAGERMQALVGLAAQDWPFVAHAIARGDAHGAGDADVQYRAEAMIRSISGPAFKAFWDDVVSWDVTPLLPEITTPTLVIEPNRPMGASTGRAIAAAIPGAQLYSHHAPYGLGGEPPEVSRLIGRFLLDIDNSRPRPTRTEATKQLVQQPQPQRIESEPASFGGGRYTVVRALGTGGQKSVYLVHDSALDRDCALALIRQDVLEPEDLLRFQREAQAMARLGAHSNIVSVYDIGEQDGRPFLVSEYIAGGDLRQLLQKRGRLPLADALAVGSDIARALAVAHARGVVHRDVKPLNIWLTEDGAAKLGDFGLAFSLDHSRLTMPGTVVGTAAYLAPEQALGEPVTELSDLYALGCLLYEMVCGKPPFADPNATAVIAQHINAAPVAPSSHEPGLPTALENLILRLLSKSPAQRPESASAVFEELRAITERLRTPGASPEPE